jgi:hypothetical protein
LYLSFTQNGQTRVTQCVNGFINGWATKNYTNGSIYNGNFNDSLEQGEGTITFKNGRIYTGIFEKGISKNGTLKYTFRDGQVTEYKLNGQVENGMISSDFILIRQDKTELIYKNGKLSARILPDKTKHEGSLLPISQDANGPGRITFPDGNVFEGEFKDGLCVDKGILKYKKTDGSEGVAKLKGTLNAVSGGKCEFIVEDEQMEISREEQVTKSKENQVYKKRPNPPQMISNRRPKKK